MADVFATPDTPPTPDAPTEKTFYGKVFDLTTPKGAPQRRLTILLPHSYAEYDPLKAIGAAAVWVRDHGRYPGDAADLARISVSLSRLGKIDAADPAAADEDYRGGLERFMLHAGEPYQVVGGFPGDTSVPRAARSSALQMRQDEFVATGTFLVMAGGKDMAALRTILVEAIRRTDADGRPAHVANRRLIRAMVLVFDAFGADMNDPTAEAAGSLPVSDNLDALLTEFARRHGLPDAVRTDWQPGDR
jgi:hypothetical protein